MQGMQCCFKCAVGRPYVCILLLERSLVAGAIDIFVDRFSKKQAFD